MQDSSVDFLLVEDNPHDAEFANQALNRKTLANSRRWLKYDEEVLGCFCYQGDYSKRRDRLPHVMLLDFSPPKHDGIKQRATIPNQQEKQNPPAVIVISLQEKRDLRLPREIEEA